MSKKSKQTVWHKKSGKFIPSKFLKSREKIEKEESSKTQTVESKDRMNDFSQKFAQEIRKALCA